MLYRKSPSVVVVAILVLFGTWSFLPAQTFATSGSCSYHKGVNCNIFDPSDGSVICNDSWSDSTVQYLDADECKVDCSKYSDLYLQWKNRVHDLEIQLVLLLDKQERTPGYCKGKLAASGSLDGGTGLEVLKLCIQAVDLEVNKARFDLDEAKRKATELENLSKQCAQDLIALENQVKDLMGDGDTQLSCINHSTLQSDRTCKCDDGYIINPKAPARCVTYNESCQLYYGTYSYGDKASCKCDTGYVFDSNEQCVLSKSPTSTPTTSPSSFPDVNSTTPYSDSIYALVAKGIIRGYTDGHYYPEKILNRAELLKLVMAAKYGDSNIAEGKVSACFTDINTQWYAKYVCFAKEQGIVKGYSDGTFKADQEIIFSEAVKISLAAFGKTFDTDPWYKGYVDYLNMNVVDLSNTLPDEKLTRGKMAYLIRFVMDKVR